MLIWWVLWTCLNKSVHRCKRGAVLPCAIEFMEHYSMVKAADILLAAPSAHSHICLYATSVPKPWPLISWIDKKKPPELLTPSPPHSQSLTVAFNLCNLIPSNIINTHVEHKHWVVSKVWRRLGNISVTQMIWGPQRQHHVSQNVKPCQQMGPTVSDKTCNLVTKVVLLGGFLCLIL